MRQTILIIIFNMNNLPLKCPGKRSPCIKVHIKRILKPVRSTVIKCCTKMHIIGKSMSHKCKILSINKLFACKFIITDYRITKANIIGLAPLNCSIIWGIWRNISKSCLSRSCRFSSKLVESLNSLTSCNKGLIIWQAIICI